MQQTTANTDDTSSTDTEIEIVTDTWGREFPAAVPTPPAADCPDCGTEIMVQKPIKGPSGTPAGRVRYAPARCRDTVDCCWSGYVTYALASVVDSEPPTPPSPEERGWDDAVDGDESGRGAGLFDAPRSEHTTIEEDVAAAKGARETGGDRA